MTKLKHTLPALPVAAGWALHAWWMHRQVDRARRDPLTQLHTRDGWQSHGRQLVQHQDAVVLLVDLDNFKQVNDIHGHHTGDLVLIAAAERLATWCNHNGMAARLGGDEFAAITLLPDDDVLHLLIAQLHDSLAEPVPALLPHLDLGVQASIGYVRAGDHPTEDLGQLLRRADAAMYRAKALVHGCSESSEYPVVTVNGRRSGRPGTAHGQIHLATRPEVGAA